MFCCKRSYPSGESWGNFDERERASELVGEVMGKEEENGEEMEGFR